MSFGKFTVKQIIENAATGLFAFEVKSKGEYSDLRQAAIKVDEELVRKWDVLIGRYDFPMYLTKTGKRVTALEAVQYQYYIVPHDEIEWNLESDIASTVIHLLGELSDENKHVVLEVMQMLKKKQDVEQSLESILRKVRQ